MKEVAREWFISIPPDNRLYTRSLEGWAYLLRDRFSEDLRRSKERADARTFKPWKETVEEYFYEKAAIHRRAEPQISEVETIREVWKGLSPHAPDLMVDRAENRDKTGGKGKRDWKPETENRNRDRGYGSRWPKKENTKEVKKEVEKEKESKTRDNRPNKRTYNTKVLTDDESENMEEDDQCSSDSSSYQSTTYAVKVVNSFLLFTRSRTVPKADKLKVIELTTPPSIGDGLSFLNGHPLPLEVWLSTPKGNTPTVMGCGDSSGQCLIRLDVLKSRAPEIKINQNANHAPCFGGVGGGVSPTLGFALVPIYIPDAEALRGNTTYGKVVKIVVEF
ncbi:hypothetical protein BGX38DRAFT_1274239 [Terfezia claveryi]|nr:hypothetical protein BGX38DRAFT_1274239 [Terfezia claveryi]